MLGEVLSAGAMPRGSCRTISSNNASTAYMIKVLATVRDTGNAGGYPASRTGFSKPLASLGRQAGGGRGDALRGGLELFRG